MKVLTRSVLPPAVVVLVASPFVYAAAAPPLRVEPVRLEIVAGESGEAAIAQPKVLFELLDDRTGRPLAPRRDELEEILGATSPLAFLDTGSGSFVLSKRTADRHALRRDAGARFVEVGVSGEHAMNVSIPYSITIASHPAAIGPAPSRRGGQRPRSEPDAGVLFRAERILVNDDVSDLTTLLGALGGAVDVIGMPAIERLIVEIQPQRTTESAVPVRIVGSRERDGLDVDLWVPLEMVDFNRRNHPDNRGPLPSLASNPLIPVVTARVGQRETSGDWLLDTGSAVTIVSTRSAIALGLWNEDGTPARPPDFSLPMGGISGKLATLRGFRIDRIEVPTERNRVIVFPSPAVVVHDITTVKDDGTVVILDGVFGMNLLLDSGTGFNRLGFDRSLPATCEQVVIDGPMSRLGLALKR